MTSHSILSPSSYGRLAYCRAAPTMEHDYPGDDTQSSREGTAAHEYAYGLMDGTEGLAVGVLNAATRLEYTQEMADGAQLYADDIASTLGPQWRGYVRLEQRIDLDNLHPEAWGTPDALAVYPKHIFCWDYKFGHLYVDAFENWQMIGYVSKLVESLSPEDELITKVTLTVVQPRSFHPDGPIRRWTVWAWELRPYLNTLKGWLAEAMETDVQASPHPKACAYCSARPQCVALRNAAYAAMDYARAKQAVKLQPHELGIELSRVEDMEALLEAYRTGLEEETEGALRHGVAVPGYTMAPGRAVLQWNVPQELLADLGDAIWKPREPITPTQARDRKLLAPELLDAYAVRPNGALKLTRVDHKLAKKVFSS